MSAAGDQFQRKVLPAEFKVIERRREAVRRMRHADTAAVTEAAPATDQPQHGRQKKRGTQFPSVGHDLRGLALSGGGIRSAAFSLGVLQGLASNGLLTGIDYLSTVSGGGLVGATISCLLNTPDVSADAHDAAGKALPDESRFPLSREIGKPEPLAVTHLRGRTRWLAPGGGLEDLRLPATILRGVLNNAAIVIPLLMAAVLVTKYLFMQATRLGFDEQLLWVPVAGASLFAIIAIVQPIVFRLGRGKFLDSWRSRDKLEWFLAFVLMCELAILVVVPMLLLVQRTLQLRIPDVMTAYQDHRRLVLGVVVATVVGLLVAARLAFSSSERLSGKLALVLIGLLGHVLVFGAFVVLTLEQGQLVLLSNSQAATSAAREERLTHLALFERVAGTRVASEFLRTAIRESAGYDVAAGTDIRVIGHVSADDTSNANGHPAAEDETLISEHRWLIRTTDCTTVRALSDWIPGHGPLFAWVGRAPAFDGIRRSLDAPIFCTELLLKPYPRSNPTNIQQVTTGWNSVDWMFFGIAFLGFGYAVLFSNPNITSWHGFFRDKMSSAFLIAIGWRPVAAPKKAPHREEPAGLAREEPASSLAPGPDLPADKIARVPTVESMDTLKLSHLNAKGTTAPYHLINATLNLQGAREGRDADFFVLAKSYCGGPTTGYCRTRDLEKRDGHLDLGTAIAISGAGLSPNSGTTTVKPLVYVTALLNLRLDYWMPNPRYINLKSELYTTNALVNLWHRARIFVAVGPIYLLKEALGLLDAKGPYVNLSDGGHVENLGVYELLRRRCRWIVAVDASEDPDMSCPALMKLIRYARIDLGVAIDINTNPLRLDSANRAYFVTGSIDYGEETEGKGVLIYVKATMTGQEPDPIRHYRERSPAFPQESSNNQFFTGPQFEAYRALGEHIIETVVAQMGPADFFWAASQMAASVPQRLETNPPEAAAAG